MALRKAVQVPDDLSRISDRKLKSLERTKGEQLRQFRSAPNPGEGKSAAEALSAMDARVAEVRDAAADLERVKAEVAARAAREKANRPSLSQLLEGTKNVHERAQEAKSAKEQQAAERRQFHAELKAAKDETNRLERERRRALGLLYEPVAPGGGDGPAALFSSAVLWEYTETKIQADGIVGEIFGARHILALWWIANLISESGGEEATFAAGTVPHWPESDGEILCREADIAHLRKNGFVEVDRQNGAGGTITYRYGSRANAIIASYREAIGKKAP